MHCLALQPRGLSEPSIEGVSCEEINRDKVTQYRADERWKAAVLLQPHWLSVREIDRTSV